MSVEPVGCVQTSETSGRPRERVRAGIPHKEESWSKGLGPGEELHGRRTWQDHGWSVGGCAAAVEWSSCGLA